MCDSLAINDIEILRRGFGRPILMLHGFQTLHPNAPFLNLLSEHGEVIAPSHPGFGRSPRPEGFDTIYDLVLFYLDLIDKIGQESVAVVGLSFGGWLAAELAVHSSRQIGKLILVDPVGIKISDRETPDIFDVFNVSPIEVWQRSWHDIRNAPDFDAMSDEEVVIHARNREALCRFAWHPYLHNPRLKSWLGRVKNQALVLWGESDGIVTPEYGRAYAKLLPNSRFELIAGAGHHPEIEQPAVCAAHIAAFLKS